MPNDARLLCNDAHMQASSDDLLLLLAVARRHTYLAAGTELGVSHTTVARRIQRLERSLGGRLLVDSPAGWTLSPLGERACDAARQIELAVAGLQSPDHHDPAGLRGLVRVSAPEAFMNRVVTAAAAELSRSNPDLRFELLSATRRASIHGQSDLDIGVSRPASPRFVTQRLADYRLALYASPSYLETHDPVEHRSDLRRHTPVYYVESMLQVADLDIVHRFFPQRRGLLGATSVEAQVRLVAAGGGIGLLPTYVAEAHSGLVPVLPGDAVADLTYWMVSRPEHARRPEVAATARAVADRAASVIAPPPDTDPV
jgi:DNA-binding transcriptional LysR family regulator